MAVWPALVLAALAVAAGATNAGAQVFFASQPHPDFLIGPLLVRASVTPALDEATIDIQFSVVVPAGQRAADRQQDLFLVWPGAVEPAPDLGPPDPVLKQLAAEHGLDVIEEGRLRLEARNPYQRGADGRRLRETVPGGAVFATFVREGALGLTAPATLIRIPWTDKTADPSWLMGLRIVSRGLIKPKPSTWFERALWGPRHRLALSFHDVRQRGMFPLYFRNRDRVVKLSEDPSQLIVSFAQADRLKIDEVFPPSARRQLSETLDNTEVVSTFLDPSEGLRPQTLSVQFGYFFGWQAWAPVLIPVVFFALGNLAGPLVRLGATRLARAVAARVHIGRADSERAIKEQGVVPSRETLARVVPGETRYADLLGLFRAHPEEQEQLAAPGQKLLVYRGRRMVPHRRRSLGWLGTVDHWDVEHHEVEIALHDDVVRDIQARVRRARLARPEATS
jgi:hypothetical protein